MTTPLLRELRQAYPCARITLLVNTTTYNLVEKCPYVDQVIAWNTKPKHRLLPRTSTMLRSLQFAASHYRHMQYDLFLSPRRGEDAERAAWLGHLSGAPSRIGCQLQETYNHDHHAQELESLFTAVFSNNQICHEVEHNLAFLRHLGLNPSSKHLELWWDDQDRQVADAFLTGIAAPDNTLMAWGIGAGSAHRTWPADRIATVIRQLSNQTKITTVIVGGYADTTTADHIVSQTSRSVVNATGKFTLRQTAALLSRCKIYVGCDSGPMHIAAAVGCRVVEISPHPKDGLAFHPNNPALFGPWGKGNIILQPDTATPPCNGHCSAQEPHCIKSITPDMVCEAINRILVPREPTDA